MFHVKHNKVEKEKNKVNQKKTNEVRAKPWEIFPGK